LFEAVSTPHRSLRPGAFLWLGALCILWALGGGVLFFLMGAWPVLPFLGVETTLVLLLVLLQHQWAGRAREVISLTPDQIVMRRVDGRGRREEASLNPYWVQVEWSERAGLALVQRNRRVEVGIFLSEEEKQDLAAALRRALAAYRQPVFDNPQLRDTP